MAVSANALTLSQYLLEANPPLVKMIGMSLLENGNFLQDVPLKNWRSISVRGVRFEGPMPTVNWGKLNSDPVVTSGTPKPYAESAYLVRNAIDVDRVLVEDINQIRNPRGVQMGFFLKALTYDMNDKFINNDPVTGNSDAYTGLRYRLSNYASYGVNQDMFIDGGGVDMSAAGMTVTSANVFIEYIQQMLDYMGDADGNGVVIYMNDIMKRRWERGLRLMGAAGGFAIVRDQFDRSISYYKGAKIVDIGRKGDQISRIITSTETSTGAAGASNFTSVYAVRYGEEYTQGWQFDSLGDSIKDIGMIGNGGTVYRTLIDYTFGLLFNHTRCIARLYDIKN